MKTLIMILALLGILLVPALAADTPDATRTRLNDLENKILVQKENLEKTKASLEKVIDDQQDGMDAETAARKSLEERVNKLAAALDAEVAARGQSDKLIAELQNELANQKLRADSLQAQLDKEKKDRAEAASALAQALEKNAKTDKKDRTITYVMGLLLGGLAASK